MNTGVTDKQRRTLWRQWWKARTAHMRSYQQRRQRIFDRVTSGQLSTAELQRALLNLWSPIHIPPFPAGHLKQESYLHTHPSPPLARALCDFSKQKKAVKLF